VNVLIKTARKMFTAALVLCLGALDPEISVAGPVHLVPEPQQIERLEGRFTFKESSAIRAGSPGLEFCAGLLRDELERVLGLRLASAFENCSEIVLAFPEVNGADRELLEGHGLIPDADLGSEGYVLLITPGKIVLSAAAEPGLFYAVQSLKQIIRAHAVERTIPCLKIRDWPEIALRGVLDDISRGPIPTMDYFKACIRRFAELKINALTYYTENVVRTEKHPYFAPPGALTPDEIRELNEYADRYHIDLIGCFQSFGHFEKILQYPQYQHLGEMGSLLSPAHQESYSLLADIYSELAPAYDSGYFLVLCDELFALGKGASENLVIQRGYARVFADHVNWIRDELGKYGVRIIVAGDEPLKHPQILPLLKKDIILLPWDYSARPSFESMLAPFTGRSFDCIVMPGISCWRRLYPDHGASLINIRNFVRDGAEHDVLGVLNATWDEWGINFFSNNWYGLAYGADRCWSPQKPDSGTFALRFGAAVHGDRSRDLAELYRRIEALFAYAPLQNMEATVFWNSLIPDYGVRAQLSIDEWSDIKRDAVAILRILDRATVSHYDRDLEFSRYFCDQLIFTADFRHSLLELAGQYRSACLAQGEEPECRRNLNAVLTGLAELSRRWSGLAQRHSYLWKLENREHALVDVLDKFSAVESDLADVRRRVEAARIDYNEGHALPPPARVRLDIRELAADFFQTWLLLGSFPNPKKDPALPSHAPGNCLGFDRDYLAEIGGESGADPLEGSILKRPDGTEVSWTRHSTRLGAKIDLRGFFQQTERVVAYAFCVIESDQDAAVKAGLGSNDGVKVFVNGDEVFQRHELRYVKADDDTVELDLKKGLNRLLLKIDQGRGNWGFAFRLLNRRVKARGHHYYLLRD